ncbi:LuxR family transcriptional regulator [Amycolatopsis cynarae]|uniref:LuxR family transcriptional regulator n=1 Tax=Amycolatopsis cynarae TaxID=2995223 RepID=A0ABY7B3G9_9PSEU|nr:LuxR family transcriptional regulator [Amycolatopsis sp. HUAS 11-8]WAL66477.1 LuxR family transcriptional regulator [Amycolatopsis sp. HUAS 11-8]
MSQGRDEERNRLRALAAGAEQGRSAALVIRAEPGAGKSALLEQVAEEAAEVRTLRTRGIEAESDLPFAALHQLLRPLLDGLALLPPPQGDALRAALGLTAGAAPDRFLVGLATLTLLAEHGPLLCLVDDAHWIDPASLAALVFAARRLDAEGVVLLFATRNADGDEFAAAGIAELSLRPLDGDSRAATYQSATSATARAARLTAAATLLADAGRGDEASALINQAARLGGTTPELVALRARIEFEDGAPQAAWRLLFDGGPELLVEAARVAWSTGDVNGLRRVSERLTGSAAELVRGAVDLLCGDPGRGLATIRRHAGDHTHDGAEAPVNNTSLALMSGDLATAEDSLLTLDAKLRSRGSIGWLPGVLTVLAETQALQGRIQESAATATEAVRIAEDTGQRRHAHHARGVLAYHAALRGSEVQEVLEVHDDSDWGRRAQALSHLAHGRFDTALSILDRITVRPHGLYFLPDQVEAAVRAGREDRALLGRLGSWARASGQPWVLAAHHRCLALVAGDPEEHFDRAVHCADVPFQQSRSRLLYGEWLRRARRKKEARRQLRAALEHFDHAGMRPWAERARAELRAAGESAVPKENDPLAMLTPQELQIVRLASTGATNKEIAAQLFLSPKTVGHHLYRAFPKLGVANRTELANLDLFPHAR